MHLLVGAIAISASAQQVAQPQLTQPQLAQPVESCRRSNSTTGVYTQPSLDSASRGILTSGETVHLEVIGTGTGWARINQPLIGWVEAKYLTPSACTGLAASLPAGQYAGQSASSTPQSSTSLPPIQITKTVKVTCDVLPSEGLVVRKQPATTGDVLYVIPTGSHSFEFTNNRLATPIGNQERQWAYITAPYQGWISLGITGGSSNLGGRECG
jgi:hypothetical protein